MTSHSRCAKDSALCDTKFCLLREHRVLADVLLNNFVAAAVFSVSYFLSVVEEFRIAAYQSLREACAILGFLSQRILNEGSNWTQKKNRMFMQIIKSRKKQRYTMRKFVLRENNFYQLVDFSVTVYFAVNFQTKAEKQLCFITFLSR